jgi:hypothetical protein
MITRRSRHSANVVDVAVARDAAGDPQALGVSYGRDRFRPQFVFREAMMGRQHRGCWLPPRRERDVQRVCFRSRVRGSAAMTRSASRARPLLASPNRGCRRWATSPVVASRNLLANTPDLEG